MLLQLGEGRFSHQWVNGTFLPVVVEFQTLLPNGLLLYTHSSPSSEVSLVVHLYIPSESILVGLFPSPINDSNLS